MIFSPILKRSRRALQMGAILGLALTTLQCDRFEKKHSTEVPADNSGKNARDTEQGPPTSENQQENETDLQLTQKIRQALVADSSLSTNAKNVKVITAQGVVTLRGPVASAQEKELVVSKAKQVSGVERVEDNLEITNP